jgi:uncharacterized protein YbjT (DUF2867 family)
MSAGNRIAVVGATGRVGHHLADVLTERGHEVVRISRTDGVDVITGEGLESALDGVACVVDVATGPSPEQRAATDFFTTAARNLQQAGSRAGVGRILVVSIINTDRMKGGYAVAKVAHERATLSGPIPARVVRAAQFHEFVEQLVQWGAQGDVAHVPTIRTQLVAAHTVAEALADLAVDPDAAPGAMLEVAGPATRMQCLGRCSRSPGRARRTWSKWRVGSSPIEPCHCESRRSTTRWTTKATSPALPCRARPLRLERGHVTRHTPRRARSRRGRRRRHQVRG